MLKAFAKKGQLICGTDEAGRGPLAGPVVAAAAILPFGFKHYLLNDSKKLSELQRNEARIIIEEHAVSFGIGILDHLQIDTLNILKASFTAMHVAIDQLNVRPELIIVDGNRFIPYPEIPHVCIIKGDAKFLEIAAASILAKTARDAIMLQLHEEYPMYGWDSNKGYPTVAHRDAIRKHGPSPYHRKSFRLLKDEQMTLWK